MRDHGLFLLALALFSATPISLASPAGSHLADAASVRTRLAKVRTTDFSRRTLRSPMGIVLTEPIIRALWAGQLITKSDWIGIQGLISIGYNIDPGGADDASNMFVYTCRGGWIDVGHVIGSAIAYKIFLQALRGSPISNLVPAFSLEPDDRDLYYKILKELSVGYQRRTSEGAKLGVDYWAGFFAIRASIHIEEIQTRAKLNTPMKKWDGNPTSAYTLEDLPSNFYGIQIGTHLARKVFVRGVVNEFDRELSKLFSQFESVDMTNVTNVKGCARLAADVLRADAAYYAKQAESTYLPTNRKKRFDLDSRSVYNFTIRHKKTLNHRCVCDANDHPINVRR